MHTNTNIPSKRDKLRSQTHRMFNGQECRHLNEFLLYTQIPFHFDANWCVQRQRRLSMFDNVFSLNNFNRFFFYLVSLCALARNFIHWMVYYSNKFRTLCCWHANEPLCEYFRISFNWRCISCKKKKPAKSLRAVYLFVLIGVRCALKHLST